jgi:hypothetical protein
MSVLIMISAQGVRLSTYQLQDIFEHLEVEELLLAKLSCKEWNKLSKTPKIKCNDVLRYGAFSGHKEICILAKKWGEESGTKMNWDQMLCNASYNGHREICDLAKKWGANDWNSMLCNASFNGHKDLCELAKKWGEESGTKMNWNTMFCCASSCSHKEICILAKKWGATG